MKTLFTAATAAALALSLAACGKGSDTSNTADTSLNDSGVPVEGNAAEGLPAETLGAPTDNLGVPTGNELVPADGNAADASTTGNTL
jgi:hypothetical protein